jgi:regulator-associated protein of mTOR
VGGAALPCKLWLTAAAAWRLQRHRARVVRVCLQRGGEDGGRLVSGDSRSEVLISDLRFNERTMALITAHQSASMNALAVHDHAPLISSGSHRQFFKIFDMEGNTLNVIKYHEGFLGQRIGPVTSLAFHPNRLLLVSGAYDACISIHAAMHDKERK